MAGDVVPHRMGNAHPSLFPYEPLPTADKDLIVIAGNDGQFRRLCAELGLDELPEDPRFAGNEARTRNREQLGPLLVAKLKERPADEWFKKLSAAGIPCGPINHVDGGVALAKELGLDPVVTVGSGPQAIPMIRNPITFSATAPRHILPPPDLDQHGDELRAWLAADKDVDQ